MAAAKSFVATHTINASAEDPVKATIKLTAGTEEIHTAASGDGPVHAFDRALRKALDPLFPRVRTIQLADYKVRILDEKSGTGAKTRVLIGTTDGHDDWTTVGVHENVIAASWIALEDAVAYGLMKAGRHV